MADGITLSFDEKQLIDGLTKVSQNLDVIKTKLVEVQVARDKAFQAGQDVSKFDKEIVQLQNDVIKTRNELGKTSDVVNKGLTKSLDNAKKSAGGFRDGMKGAAKEVNIFGVNLGNTIDQLKAKRQALRGVATGLKGTVSGFKALRVAIIATGIGALVVALGALYAAFTRTNEGANQVEVIMSQIGSVFDVILDRAAKLGTAIVQLFSGDFAGAAATAKEAFAGVGDEILREIELAGQLTRVLQRVREENARLEIQRAFANKELKALNFIIEDQTKSYKDRTNAAVKFANIEEDLVKREIENQRDLVAALLGVPEVTEDVIKAIEEIGRTGNVAFDQLGISESKIDDLEKFKDEARKLFDLETRSLEVQTTNNNKLNQVRKEQRDKAKAAAEARAKALEEERKRILKLQEAYAALAQSINDRFQDEEVEKLSGAEKLVEQRRIAIEELEALEDELTQAAASVGEELPEETKRKIKGLYQNLDDELKKNIEEIRKDDKFLTLPPPTFLTEGTDFAEVGKKVADGIKVGFDENLNLVDQFRRELQLLTGATDEELNFLFDNLSQLGSSFLDGITANTEAAIKQQEEIVASYDRSISKLESKLEEEKQLAAEGKANDVALLQAQLTEENELRATAEAERLELEEKAAKQRILIESLQQASALALAGAKLFAAEAGKGIIGIGLAIGALALMLSTIARFKAQATKQSAPQFAEGGSLSDEVGLIIGPSHSSGGVPGHYTDSKGNRRAIEMEGGEFITKAASVTDETRPILEAINKDGKIPAVARNEYKNESGYGLTAMPRINGIKKDYDRIKLQLEQRDQQSAKQLQSVNSKLDELTKAVKEKDDKQFHPDGSYHHRRKDARGNEQVDFVRMRRN